MFLIVHTQYWHNPWPALLAIILGIKGLVRGRLPTRIYQMKSECDHPDQLQDSQHLKCIWRISPPYTFVHDLRYDFRWTQSTQDTNLFSDVFLAMSLRKICRNSSTWTYLEQCLYLLKVYSVTSLHKVCMLLKPVQLPGQDSVRPVLNPVCGSYFEGFRPLSVFSMTSEVFTWSQYSFRENIIYISTEGLMFSLVISENLY